ncbi:MAG: hypothetical protein L0216_06980 [Planctomycetales bacterium]|nr:hypothetical protein [Planctomycetales bacterium]
MAKDKGGPSLHEVAEGAGVDVEIARQILNEIPGQNHPKDLQDRVFGTARKLGYDLKKLKIGKRMDLGRQTLEEVLREIESHPEWGRGEILKRLAQRLDLVKRVQKKAFAEEFPD